MKLENWVSRGLGGELGGEHALVPLNDLDPVAVECLGKDKTTEGVTALVGTMGVHLTPRVVGGEVDVLLLDETSNLDIVGGLDVLDAGQRTRRDDTGAVVGLCAPGDGLREKMRGSDKRVCNIGWVSEMREPTSPSMTPISELGLGALQRQKSSMPLMTAVWHMEFGPAVYIY
jgi:hypothetical protein